MSETEGEAGVASPETFTIARAGVFTSLAEAIAIELRIQQYDDPDLTILEHHVTEGDRRYSVTVEDVTDVEEPR